MAATVSSIDKFHKTKQGKLVFGVIEILVAYLFVSRAIDTGSLWQYGAATLLFIGGLINLIKIVFQLIKSDAKKSSKKR